MDTTTKKRTATIDNVERLQNTLNGNPQYLVQFTDGAVMHTEPDAGWVYGVSLTYMRGDVVDIEYHRQGFSPADPVVILDFLAPAEVE